MVTINTDHQLVQIFSASEARELRRHPEMPEFDWERLASHRADAHWVVVKKGLLVARCSLWWEHTPTIPVGKAGLIGHYAAADNLSGSMLLDFVCSRLANRGCTLALGPMDQNTWRDYRYVTRFGNRPQFFLEPENRPAWREQFCGVGFRETARYFSSLVKDLAIRNPRVDQARRRMKARDIRIRTLCRNDLDAELRHIHTVVRSAFTNNPFYVPVDEQDFLEMYRPLRDRVPTDLILLAQRADRVVGFCFAFPDMLQAARGLPTDTVVVKTFAVLPQFSCAGIGQVLLEEVHARALSSGFRCGIHALVRDAPHMRRIIGRYGTSFREYALFGKELS